MTAAIPPALAAWMPSASSTSRAVRGGLAATLAALILAVVANLVFGGASNGHLRHSRVGAGPEPAARASSQEAQPVNHNPAPVTTSGNSYGYIRAWLGRAKVPVGRV